jgi:hypothetical protein
MPDQPTPSPSEREELLVFSARRLRAELEKWYPDHYRADADEREAFVEGFRHGSAISLSLLAHSVASEPLRVPDVPDPAKTAEIEAAFIDRVFAQLAEMEKAEANWTISMLLEAGEDG